MRNAFAVLSQAAASGKMKIPPPQEFAMSPADRFRLQAQGRAEQMPAALKASADRVAATFAEVVEVPANARNAKIAIEDLEFVVMQAVDVAGKVTANHELFDQLRESLRDTINRVAEEYDGINMGQIAPELHPELSQRLQNLANYTSSVMQEIVMEASASGNTRMRNDARI